jgi:hypothetical protein
MYNSPKRMRTFFLRAGVIAVLVSGCHRGGERTRGQPAPRPDTVVITVPVIRFTTADTTDSSARLDSASLALVERRVMSRLASLMRAEKDFASGTKTVGITPVKNAVPEIEHGLLGAINFGEDGDLAATSRERIAAIAELLPDLEGSLEIRVVTISEMPNIDVAIARARRVYMELISRKPTLAARDVAITVTARSAAMLASNQVVQVFWRGEP